MPRTLAHPGHGLSSQGGFLSLPQPLLLSTSQALVGTGATGDQGAQQGRGIAGMKPLSSLQQVLLLWPKLGRAVPTVLPQFQHSLPNPFPTPQLRLLIPCHITSSLTLLPPPLSH